jgi:hypothetical protein
MISSPIDTYRRQIERELQAGNATEHTHRPALKTLIESLASGVTATNEPRRVECGAPDFVISRKATHGPVTLGHIEAKDVAKDLEEHRGSDYKGYFTDFNKSISVRFQPVYTPSNHAPPGGRLFAKGFREPSNPDIR